MSDKAFIDTNILLYAYDRNAGIKHKAAKTLLRWCWEEGKGVVSIQVLCEFFARATRQTDPIVDAEEAESIVRNLSSHWQVIALDIEMVVEAIRAFREYQLSFWDSLIWAAAKGANIQRIYTLEGVEFHNPFME
jgi:predicted nucleic acid-binding protein